MYRKAFTLKLTAVSVLFGLVFFIFSCKKSDTPPVKQLQNFKVRILAANNNEYAAGQILPALQNAWGLAWSPTGIAWVNTEVGHVSDVMDSIGNPLALDPVNIPSPSNTTGGSPTGIVFNSNSGQFLITSGNGSASQEARFIFAGSDGVLSAWNGTWGHNSIRVAADDRSSYTGLTLASFDGNNYLYAANFAMMRIDVWDKNWTPVKWPGAFTDPHLPTGYSPFNVQMVEGKLYVMYAKMSEGDEVKGAGFGIVDVYTTSGMLEKRFATRGKLNAPWGLAMAPAGFFRIENNRSHDADDRSSAILVGNFGDGRINAYSEDGKFLGQLSIHSLPITIEGLWAISFAPSTSSISQNLLYFTAGPHDEHDGLFGYISKVADDD